ncbi:MAG: hypothetical protein Unbinned3907contig1000_41 [Prokaryotic dsDNA virus sp.]|nr:MAG: hypothetical protein Unbinned3907contig1000_41 [Prokaryotic dsDNA virus sp.]|tara:strand:- start:3405 stop:4004 length:600 start_codon:yes stop_codon:yes gene_type:complete
MKKSKITDLKFDDKNFNKGTQYGKSLMEKSLSKFGAGRSILIDKNNRIIAGNKTTENFGELGLEDVKIVETDGKTLIAVKRNDIDLSTPEGREFALADNQTAKTNIDFDFQLLEDELDESQIEEWGLHSSISDKNIDYSVLEDLDLDGVIDLKEGNIKRAICLEFNPEHYDQARRLTDDARKEGKDVGLIILNAFKNLK